MLKQGLDQKKHNVLFKKIESNKIINELTQELQTLTENKIEDQSNLTIPHLNTSTNNQKENNKLSKTVRSQKIQQP